jgi:hypothetical protein
MPSIKGIREQTQASLFLKLRVFTQSESPALPTPKIMSQVFKLRINGLAPSIITMR